VEGPKSSPKHFRGRFFARTYFLRPVRVLIAQSIRTRALSGAKKKSNGDLFLLSSSFSFLSFFFSFLFEHRSSLTLENRRSDDDRSSDFADQCRIAAFATRRRSSRQRWKTLNITFSSLNLSLEKIEFCPPAYSLLILDDRDPYLFPKSQSLIYLPTLEYATEVLFKR